MNIGILILATNTYLPLGMRLVNRFHHFYRGNANIKFYFCSNQNPIAYLKDEIDIKFIFNMHESWLDGTNSKFKNLLSLENEDLDYIYYMDADTNVLQEFDEEWMLGDTVAAQHFNDQDLQKDKKAYDRNPESKAYIPLDTKLPQMYYHGAFFGGRKANLLEMCQTMQAWQDEDQLIPYEPAVNDESYINAYFHYNPPAKVLPYSGFKFWPSDGGGIPSKRNPQSTSYLTKEIIKNKDKLWDIQDNRITYE